MAKNLHGQQTTKPLKPGGVSGNELGMVSREKKAAVLLDFVQMRGGGLFTFFGSRQIGRGERE